MGADERRDDAVGGPRRRALRVVGEVTDWRGHSPEALRAMRDHLAELRQLGVEAIDD